MADDTEGDKAAAPAAPKSKKTMLFIIAGVLVLALGGGGAYVFLSSKPKAAHEEEKKKTAFIDLKEMLIGMQPDAATPQDRGRYMKIKVALELADEHLVQTVQPLMPRVEDIFQIYLRDLRPSELQGTAGMFKLKEELLRRVNLAVQPAHVDAILFKEIVVQ